MASVLRDLNGGIGAAENGTGVAGKAGQQMVPLSELARVQAMYEREVANRKSVESDRDALSLRLVAARTTAASNAPSSAAVAQAAAADEAREVAEGRLAEVDQQNKELGNTVMALQGEVSRLSHLLATAQAPAQHAMAPDAASIVERLSSENRAHFDARIAAENAHDAALFQMDLARKQLRVATAEHVDREIRFKKTVASAARALEGHISVLQADAEEAAGAGKTAAASSAGAALHIVRSLGAMLSSMDHERDAEFDAVQKALSVLDAEVNTGRRSDDDESGDDLLASSTAEADANNVAMITTAEVTEPVAVVNLAPVRPVAVRKVTGSGSGGAVRRINPAETADEWVVVVDDSPAAPPQEQDAVIRRLKRKNQELNRRVNMLEESFIGGEPHGHGQTHVDSEWQHHGDQAVHTPVRDGAAEADAAEVARLRRKVGAMEDLVMQKTEAIQVLQTQNMNLTFQMDGTGAAAADGGPVYYEYVTAAGLEVAPGDPLAAAAAAAAAMAAMPNERVARAEKFLTMRQKVKARREMTRSKSASERSEDSFHHFGENDVFETPAREFLYSECEKMLSTEYNFVKRLAIGPDNAVYKAQSKDDGSYVAVKIIEGLASMKNPSKEVICLRQVQGHPNIQRLIKWVPLQRTRCHAIVSEWVDDSRVDCSDPRRIRGYMRDVLAAVEWCHTRKVINRDIKPDNILYDAANWKATMIDFDCAAPYNPDRLPSKRVGTDGYFAPEIDGTYKHHNRRRYDTKVDIWSAGITFAKYLFWEANAGRTPSKERVAELLSRIHTLQPEHHLLRKMLETDPRRRITATEALAHPYFSGSMGKAAPTVAAPSASSAQVSSTGSTGTSGSGSGRSAAVVRGGVMMAAPVSSVPVPAPKPVGGQKHRHQMKAGGGGGVGSGMRRRPIGNARVGAQAPSGGGKYGRRVGGVGASSAGIRVGGSAASPAGHHRGHKKQPKVQMGGPMRPRGRR